MQITIYDPQVPALALCDTPGDTLVAECLRAAELGDTTAFLDLGLAFSVAGYGVPLDMIEAYKWYELAGAVGLEEAHECRDDLAEHMLADEIAEAQRRSQEWLASGALPN